MLKRESAWADLLYNLVEHQLVPTFHDRNPSGVPERWVRMVKESIRTVLPRFSTRRMVKEYGRRLYAPVVRPMSHSRQPSRKGPEPI